MSKIVYKFVCKTNWSLFIKSGAKECKGFDNDLTDGFIHLSTYEQLYSTFIKKYSLKDKDKFNILALQLKPTDDVRWEKAKNGNIYPHLYSPLLLKNVLWVYSLENYHFDNGKGNSNGI